jgi:hypothetical protein
VGVVKSLDGFPCGPVVLVRIQNLQVFKKEKPNLCELARSASRAGRAPRFHQLAAFLQSITAMVAEQPEF